MARAWTRARFWHQPALNSTSTLSIFAVSRWECPLFRRGTPRAVFVVAGGSPSSGFEKTGRGFAGSNRLVGEGSRTP